MIITLTLGGIFLFLPAYRLYRRSNLRNHIKRVVRKRFVVKTNKIGKV
jgi:hypothetical protein